MSYGWNSSIFLYILLTIEFILQFNSVYYNFLRLTGCMLMSEDKVKCYASLFLRQVILSITNMR